MKLIYETAVTDLPDLLICAWLATRNDIDLKAVIVSPGSLAQCRAVRFILNKSLCHSVPIGISDDVDTKIILNSRTLLLPKNGLSLPEDIYHVFGEEIRTYPFGPIYEAKKLLSLSVEDATSYFLTCSPTTLLNFVNSGAKISKCFLCRSFSGDNLKPIDITNVECVQTVSQVTLQIIASENIKEKIIVSIPKNRPCNQEYFFSNLNPVIRKILRCKNLKLPLLPLNKFAAAAMCLDANVCPYEKKVYWDSGGKIGIGLNCFFSDSYCFHTLCGIFNS